MKNNKLLILGLGGLLVVGGGAFLVLRGGGRESTPKEAEEVVKESQKTLEELQGKEEKISFEKTIAKDETFEVDFRFRDYKDVPQDNASLEEIQGSLIPLPGKASFKVIETGTIDKINEVTQAHAGETLYYLLYEFKGDGTNPEGNTIHPGSLEETGWDPAPQFVAIIEGDDKYSSSFYNRPMLQGKGYEAPLFGAKFVDTDWSTQAAVWEVDQGQTPAVALKYIDIQGTPHYLKVSL